MPQACLCQSVPVIVAAPAPIVISSGSYGPSTVYTPSATGLFRLSAYIAGEFAGSFVVSWTDNNGSQSQQISRSYPNGGADDTCVSLFFSAVAAPIQIAVSGSGSQPYTIYVIVEQLG